MIYLSAGHHFNPAKADPGAVSGKWKENELTRELRDLTLAELKKRGASVIIDKDSETLGQYLARIKPGSGSIVCEPHFNASANKAATGSECLYQDGADLTNRHLSADVSAMLSQEMGIKNRGAKSEKESARGSLALFNTKAGIACLPEICFITNEDDMARYQEAKKRIAVRLAEILMEYDALRS